MPSPHARSHVRAKRIPARLAACVWACVVSLAVGQYPLDAQAEPAAPLYRVFLKDGTPLISYGALTRLGDRVVFSVPVGQSTRGDNLQIISLPVSAVDWDRTSAYADSVRYQHYAATRGEADFEKLANDVARALNDVALAKDPGERLARARAIRATLIDWPRTHYGYRANDVRDFLQIVDESLTAALADLGERTFSLDLVASIQPPDGVLLPEPSVMQGIEAARAAARVVDTPAERASLQQAILSALSSRPPGVPSSWASKMKDDVSREVRTDRRAAETFVRLRTEALRTAERRVDAADVVGVERVVARVRQDADRLGSRYAADVAWLSGVLETHLADARQYRLELDRWQYRNDTYATYRKQLARLIDRADDVRPSLEAIRAVSGPEPARLPRLLERIGKLARDGSTLAPPPDFQDGHGALTSSLSLMAEAVRQRDEAVRRADARLATNASAAAAGSLLLLERARSGLVAYFARPARP